MLRIQAQQMADFAEDAVKDFEDRMWKHLGDLFPAYVEALGEGATRALVHEGIERAGRHGIVTERGVCVFIDAMFAFGKRFDEELPWAAEILTGEGPPDARAHRLFEAAFEHLQEASGVFA